MESYIWLIRKVDSGELAWPIAASVIFHVLLCAILVTTSVFYPLTGHAEKINIIWLSTASIPGVETGGGDVLPLTAEEAKAKADDGETNAPAPEIEAPPKPDAPVYEQAVAPEVPDTTFTMMHAVVRAPEPKPAPTAASNKKLPPPAAVREAPPKRPEEPKPPQRDAAVLAAKEVHPADSERERQDAVKAALEKAAQERHVRENAERERIAAEKAEQELQAAARAAQAQAERERLAAEKVAEENAELERLAREKAIKERVAAEKADQERRVRESAEQERTAAERLEQERQAAARAAKAQAEREQQAAAQKAAQERLAREKARQERLAAERAEQERHAREKLARERLAAERAELERLAAARAAQAQAEQEKLAAAKKAVQERLAREKASLERQAAEKAERERIAREETERLRREAKLAERVRLARNRAAADRQVRETVKAEHGVEAKNAAVTPKKTESSGKDTATVARAMEQNKTQPSKSASEAAQPIVPPIYGDLKMIVEARKDLKISVLFREYPKARRNRPMTKAEASRAQKVSPLVLKTLNNTREIIIKAAGQGIYDFLAEPDGGEANEGAFTLKLFETTNGARIKPLGSRKVGGKTVIARILMPEGILWDDESAFSGSIEDSESTTKFNTETGLTWKEYRK